MAEDDFTLHKFRALADCPQGQRAGDIFEATADAGAILVSFGVAERLPDEPRSTEPVAAAKGKYNRRDLSAKE